LSIDLTLTRLFHSAKVYLSSDAGTSFALITLLLCSLLFSQYHSNTPFTSDEVWSINTARLNYRSELAALKADVHPPLYFQILSIWVRAFGTGERAVRALSGLFYVLSVFGVFGIGKHLYGTRSGVLCAAIYLSSPLAILSAQFARMYSLLALLSILSTWSYIQFSIKPRESRILFALYVAVNALGTFTHIAFFFLLFAQLVFHVLFYRSLRLRRFIIALVLSVLPYMFLWGPTLLGQISNSREGVAWVKKPGLSMMADLLLQYGGAFWLIIPLLLYVWFRNRRDPSAKFGKMIQNFPIWLLILTLLTPILISEVKPIFNSRLAIVGLHLFALSIGSFVGRRASYLLPFALIALTVAFLIVVHPTSTPCDNREMAAYLNQNANEDDVMIFTSLTRLPIDYYLLRTPTKRLFETSFPTDIDRHPGYEGNFRDPSRRAGLESEAKAIIDKIVSLETSDRSRRIFFFHGFHPETDAIMESQLRKRFELLNDQGVHCEDAQYFKEVSVYR
jgi:4-amino-4-deoxy-L-arabinose transferase-like glycosyltransferase